jgi:hypothetical protein
MVDFHLWRVWTSLEFEESERLLCGHLLCVAAPYKFWLSMVCESPGGPNQYPLYVPFYAHLVIQKQAMMNWGFTLHASCCFSEAQLVFLFVHLLGSSQHHNTEFYVALKCDRSPWHRCLYNGLFAPIFEWITMLFTHSQNLIKLWGWCHYSAWHCCSWLRWPADALWATCLKVWMTALICWVTLILWSVVVEYAGEVP